MNFRIADTFTASLARLTGDEQKAVKTTAFDLQLDPASPGMRFHKLDKARDKNFWSVRVSSDIRLIVHRTDASLLLCYVAHHDDAYRWAERRKLEIHPTTGAAQLVEVRETVREITVPKYVEAEAPPSAPRQQKPLLFSDVAEEELLAYGVPAEWIDDVHRADEDSLFELAEHLPQEAAEALLNLATGSRPQPALFETAPTDPFLHPDALRRFRVMANAEELAQAMDAPWERWSVFLHPGQRELVERSYNGPARVAGSAGTGKTVVALHRAAHVAEQNPTARVLLTTFSAPLAKSLEGKLKVLLGNRPRVQERIDVCGIAQLGERLYASRFGPLNLASEQAMRSILAEAAAAAPAHRFSAHFIWTEWNEVVDAWQVATWEAYRDVPRLGRKTRLGEAQRKTLWQVFSAARESLAAQGLLTQPMVLARLTERLVEERKPPYDFAVVDEAQDIGVPELRFLAALGGGRPDALFFAGDLGQRIFQPPFSWKSLGVDVRGRSRTLRFNYRTSHQIRVQADRLLPPELSDVDGIAEERGGTVSVFDGPEPVVDVFNSAAEETAAVAAWLKTRLEEGVAPHEFGVVVRSEGQYDRAKHAIAAAGLHVHELTGDVEPREGCVSLLTMHLAKGLEFRAVAVMACDDEILPLQERISAVADDSDLEEVYNTERHLLYVACTRARERLLVSGVRPASEFLDDLAEVVDG